MPGSFPGIAHIYIHEGGAGSGSRVGLEAIPFIVPRNFYIWSLKKISTEEALSREWKVPSKRLAISQDIF